MSFFACLHALWGKPNLEFFSWYGNTSPFKNGIIIILSIHVISHALFAAMEIVSLIVRSFHHIISVTPSFTRLMLTPLNTLMDSEFMPPPQLLTTKFFLV